ncbi:MAG: adenylate kinase [Candidatus ainarchaeum sp.]|nr:adenylate kinase [Candidatus ainarchaeum sp.]
MIIVMGIPGAGKTTVLSETLRQAKGWRAINWGDRMLELAAAKGFAKGRDEIRKLPVERQAELQAAVADSLAREEGKFVLDTHCSINTPKGYLPGLPYGVLGKLPVERFVLIEAPAESIIARRRKDATRARDAQAAEAVAEQLFVNKALVCAYAAFKGAPVAFVKNEDGKLSAAVEALRALLG